MKSGTPTAVQTEKAGKHKRRRTRWRRRILVAFVFMVLLGGAVRLALPSYLQAYVNQVLDQSPDYDGSIGTISVRLLRGSYTIHDVRIVKTTHAVQVPFFESPQMDFAISWNALLNGSVRGKVVIEKPRLNFVHGPSPEETQIGDDQQWLGMLNDLFPFRIDDAELHNGEVHFHTFHTTPKVNVYITDLQAHITNLTNTASKLDPLIAEAHATGTAMESGRFEFDMSLDPQSRRPSFNLAARLLDLDVREINSLSLAYGDFDFEQGHLDFVLEVAVKDGYMEGYAKPLFRNIKVLTLRDFGKKDPLQLFWEALVGIGMGIFKNQFRDQFGTRITIEGDLDNPRTNILEIVGNVLYNAFVRAYLPRIEGHVAPDVIVPEDEKKP